MKVCPASFLRGFCACLCKDVEFAATVSNYLPSLPEHRLNLKPHEGGPSPLVCQSGSRIMADPMTPERLDSCLRRLMSLRVPQDTLAAVKPIHAGLQNICRDYCNLDSHALPGLPQHRDAGVLDGALPGLCQAAV